MSPTEILRQKLQILLDNNPTEIIEQELAAIYPNDNSTIIFTQALQAIKQRQADINILQQIKWQNLVHVLVQFLSFNNYPSIEIAQKYLIKAKQCYNELLSDFIPGPIAIRIEIGYNKSGWHIHAHLFCEYMANAQFKLNTKDLRQGPQKILTSRIAARRWRRQSTQHYQNKLYNYNTKFSTLVTQKPAGATRQAVTVPFIPAPLFIRKFNIPALAKQTIVKLSETDRQTVARVNLSRIVESRKNTIQIQVKSRFCQSDDYPPTIDLDFSDLENPINYVKYKPDKKILEYSG